MACSKIKKISIILLCLFVILFPFWCVRGLCAEPETVEPERISSLQYTTSSNYFINNPSSSVYVYAIEPGYTYNFINNTVSARSFVISTERPAPNVTYEILTVISAGDTYSYIGSGYVFITGASDTLTVNREKVTGMNSTINDLVDNVGINSIWNIFDISINYIVIVVLVAFGIYIIYRIIRKISRGKEGL